jgi:hypothetical protein
MTEPAKPVEKPISKEEQRIKDLETLRDLKEIEKNGALSQVSYLKTQLERVSLILGNTNADLASHRGAYKVQKAEADALKAKLAADPNLAELVALRAEVSSLHTTVNRKETLVQEALVLNDTFLRRAKEQEQKNVAIMGTLTTMQIARDRAAERESGSYQKLAIAERDLEAAKRDAFEARKEDAESCARLKDVHIIHQRGHPEPTAGCALCAALGREVSPAAAAKPSVVDAEPVKS